MCEIKNVENLILTSPFLNTIRQANSIYDMIAICYDKLLEYKNDSDMIFLSRAGNMSDDVIFATCADYFDDFRESITNSVLRIDSFAYSDNISFEEFRAKLICVFEHLECPSEMEKEDFISFCMFFTIEALDCYIQKNISYLCDTLSTMGPLNDFASDNCAVYIQEQTSFLSGAYKTGDRGFRRPLRCTRIGSVFHNVLIIESRHFLASTPRIIPLRLSSKSEIRNNKSFRIASIPFAGFESFNFHEINSEYPCEKNQLPKGLFYVEYFESNDDNINRIIALLKLAIQKSANFIIFPEFIMSADMLEALKSELRKMSFIEKAQLILVFAGTCCETNNGNKNNIMHILNSDGIEVGCYYKYSPFLKQSEEQFHGALFESFEENMHSEDYKKRKYLVNCEMISNPGEECTLFDVESIGRILPSICRDVIDGTYTENLSALFMPSLLMISSWSSSVSSFDSRLSLLAETIHTSSILCNCCNAVIGDGKKSIGKFVYPRMNNTTIKAVKKDIKRKESCLSSCESNGGCIRLIDVDHSKSEPEITLYSCIGNNHIKQQSKRR